MFIFKNIYINDKITYILQNQHKKYYKSRKYDSNQQK